MKPGQSAPRLVPLAPCEAEIVINRSRFIASLSPASSPEEARAFLQEIKKRFAEATHHVPAFIIGHGASTITHCSDDGEPSGTAGRPALAVLQGSGLGNVVVCVTRYFGGVKLGTGGLVRAYGDAVREVLKSVQKAVLLPTRVLAFTCPYPLYEQILILVRNHSGEVLQNDFAEEVRLQARFFDPDVEDFITAIRNLSAGKVLPQVLSCNAETPCPYVDPATG